MRKLASIFVGLGLISTAASAEPAKLSEGELGQVTAGQGVGVGLSLSVAETVTNTTSTVSDNDTAVSTFESNTSAMQSLSGQSSNTVSALGMLGASGVSATGNANALVTGTSTNNTP